MTDQVPEQFNLAPEKRPVLAAVGWLLGAELVGRLAKILRHRSDPRDWMGYTRKTVHDERAGKNGELVTVGSAATQSALHGEIVAADTVDTGGEEVWFDYASDMGDSVDAMYSIAYGTLCSFNWVEHEHTKERIREELTAVHDAPKAAQLHRGQFLFVGGDTAYHVADGATLRSRVEAPFLWALRDCAEATPPLISLDDTKRDRSPRRIYGIPGNHDWYDNLAGFSRLFRVSSPVEGDPHAMDLRGYIPRQLASYCAIQLPYDWQLWGLDVDEPMDPRQKVYFQDLVEAKPSGLIVATASPAIVFGASLREKKPKLRQTDAEQYRRKNNHLTAWQDLKIEVPTPKDQTWSLPASAPHKARLDLSGDVHHYARYFPREKPSNYGSVVSGLGGAFHHPVFTDATDVAAGARIPAHTIYPQEKSSLAMVARGLLDWRASWLGSWARVVPFLLTVLYLMALELGTSPGRGAGAFVEAIVGITRWHWPYSDRHDEIFVAALFVGGLIVAGVLVAFVVKSVKGIYAAHERSPTRAQNVVEVWNSWPWKTSKDRTLARKAVDFFGDLLGVVGKTFDRTRSYWWPWTASILIVVGMILFAYFLNDATALDVTTVLVTAALPFGGVLLGAVAGGHHLSRAGKVGLGVIGFLHMAGHVVIPMAVAHAVYRSWFGLPLEVLAIALFAFMLEVARWVFSWKRGGATAFFLGLLALLCIGVTVLLMGVASGSPHPTTVDHWRIVRAGVGAVLAMPLGTMWFLWYLAICAHLNGHNNEVGGAARVTDFRQFIRFRVHQGGITGYVIAVEDQDRREWLDQDKDNEKDNQGVKTRAIPELGKQSVPTSRDKIASWSKTVAVREQGKNLKFTLIDVFTVEKKA